MIIIKRCVLILSLFSFCMLAGFAGDSNVSWVTEAQAGAEGPLFKLRKPAKLHVTALGASEVLEIVWTNATCVWLDKQGVWVQVRMQDTDHIGWIHYKYLMPASMKISAAQE
ncbi:MAG: SH3 domain-containing protein [Mariprofundus sp.]|nr:SH3 domain-containing protein [Mariprofundus sp.]